MAKLMQVEEVFDVTQKPEEFKARYEEVNGRKVLVVSAKAETIVRPDGTKDVVMHVPALDLVNKFKEENEGMIDTLLIELGLQYLKSS